MYHSIYKLPFNYENESEEISDQMRESSLNDRIFMWAILLFGCENDLDIIKYFWSKTNHPVSCALAAMVIYQRLMNKFGVHLLYNDSTTVTNSFNSSSNYKYG